MKHQEVLLLSGLDENTLAADAECTRAMIVRAQEALRSRGWNVAACLVNQDLESALEPYSPERWIVFNLCEGSPGQAFYYARAAQVLQARGFAFTGSGAVALHKTQFKSSMKRLLSEARVPTPDWHAADRAEDLQFDRFPAIVKADGEHCSFGITRDSVVFDLKQARRRAAAMIEQYHAGAVIEEFLDSPEYGVALWEADRRLEILGISEIRYDALPELQDRLCSFDAKWIPESDTYRKTMPSCPAPVSPEFSNQLAELARQAYVACDLRDYGRVDIRIRGGAPMVLDVNANCALSENAGFPDTARIAGLDYATVLDRLARMAARRAAPIDTILQLAESGRTSI